MLTSHELFSFMSPELSARILEETFSANKEMYKATLAAIAQARKLRPVFLERQPRSQRHVTMTEALARPGMAAAADGLLRAWLLKSQTALLQDFLDALGVAHQDGVVEELPDGVEDAKLDGAVDTILAKHPKEIVILYLHAFHSMNDSAWKNLDERLSTDSRIQF